MQSGNGDRSNGMLHALLVAGLILTSGTLAVTSTAGDSITFDETNHLTGGMSYLLTGDFRLAPETPPLAQMWAALPLMPLKVDWPSSKRQGWLRGNVWQVGREWLFDLNDGEHLVFVARCSIAVLLMLTCFFTYLLARALFGPSAGLLAVTLACLSPTLLAHGSLVTTDVAFALGCLAVTLSFARLTTGISPARVLLAIGAMSGLALTKFSWPIMVPAVLVIGGAAVMRGTAIPYGLWLPGEGAARPLTNPQRMLSGRKERLLAFAAIMLVTVVCVWGAIWGCYGFRYSPFRGEADPLAMMSKLHDPNQPDPTTMEEAWTTITVDWEGRPIAGPVAWSIRSAREHRLLPEAYLYGFSYTVKLLHGWRSYLCGEYSRSGWWYYFPTAFAVKTPLVTILLIVLGGVALVAGRCGQVRNLPLALGVSALLITYGIATVTSRYNIGHRHLVPIYPILFVMAGGAVHWLRYRAGRWLLVASLLLLSLTNLAAFPHYLGFFNAAVGGSGNGSKYLSDSNIDWGQDLKRLAAYARQIPDETIKLAYFGSALPTHYGFRCEAMPSFLPFGPPAQLTAGVYVSSVTQLLGVFDYRMRDSFWTEENLATYRKLELAAANGLQGDLSQSQQDSVSLVTARFEDLRRVRLLNGLRRRTPDDFIGTSLLVHVLSADDVAELTSSAPRE